MFNELQEKQYVTIAVPYQTLTGSDSYVPRCTPYMFITYSFFNYMFIATKLFIKTNLIQL